MIIITTINTCYYYCYYVSIVISNYHIGVIITVVVIAGVRLCSGTRLIDRDPAIDYARSYTRGVQSTRH